VNFLSYAMAAFFAGICMFGPVVVSIAAQENYDVVIANGRF
jgi:hypothetical protein